MCFAVSTSDYAGRFAASGYEPFSRDEKAVIEAGTLSFILLNAVRVV
jgi:hypothetical protein